MDFSFRSFRSIRVPALVLLSVWYMAELLLFFYPPPLPTLYHTSIAISRAGAEGANIPERLQYYFTLLWLLPLLFVLLYRALSFLLPRAPSVLKVVFFEGVLAVGGLLLCLQEVCGMSAVTGRQLLLLVSVLYPCFHYLSRLSFFQCFRQKETLWSLFYIAFLLTLVFQFHLKIPNWFVQHRILNFVLILCISFILFPLLRFPPKIQKALSVWLLLIPLLIFFSQEIRIYAFDTYRQIYPAYLFFWFTSLVVVLVSWSTIPRRVSIHSLNTYFPASVLIAVILMAYYEVARLQPTEFFELANPAVAQLRIFQFHEWPVLDFISSHFFSEQFYGILYHSLFGFHNDLSFLVYEFLYTLLFLILVFIFLKRVFFSMPLALLFILCFPFTEHVFSLHLFFFVPSAFVLFNVLQLNQVRDWILLALSILFLFFWRLDTGLVAACSGGTILLMHFSIQKRRISYKPFVKALILVLIICLLLGVLVLCFTSFPDVWQKAILVKEYAGAHQAHGYPQLFHSFDQQVTLLYILLPFISLLLTGIQFATWKKNKQISLLSFFALFFLTAVLFNFQRGLVRHHFMEGNDSYLIATFFIGVLCFVFQYLERLHILWRFFYFSAAAFSLVMLWSVFPLDTASGISERAMKKNTLLQPDKDLFSPKRVRRIFRDSVWEQQQYQPLKQWLNEHLKPGQTFFDFSNAPMLYYYCKRLPPSYFCQSMQNAVTHRIQQYDIDRWDMNRIPVVVYAHAPRNWFDATDGIPNTMRQYSYAEFIFQHYKPYGIIGSYSVWIDKNWQWNSIPFLADSLLDQASEDTYESNAMALQAYYLHHQDAFQELITLQDSSWNRIPSSLMGRDKLWLQIQVQEISNREVTLKWYLGDTRTHSISFTTSPAQQHYLVRISNHWNWYHKIPDRMECEGAKIRSLTYLSDR